MLCARKKVLPCGARNSHQKKKGIDYLPERKHKFFEEKGGPIVPLKESPESPLQQRAR